MTALDAFFLPAGPGRSGERLCLFHAPRGTPARGAIVHVHAFAEEMNKSRRMVALQARALADAGYAVLQIDLLGCGDSSGDFGDASWPEWIDDVLLACRWLQQRCPAPLWLWGLRAGCLLAAEAASRLGAPCHFLFWQPAVSGKQALQQFLRLKVAGEMLNAGGSGVMEGLRQRLAGGSAIEIAGYDLAPALATGFEQAGLMPPAGVTPPAGRMPPPGPGRLEWIELSGRPEPSLAPASSKPLAAWAAAGFDVRSHCVGGPAFWQTTEIEDAPALLQATLAALREPVPA